MVERERLRQVLTLRVIREDVRDVCSVGVGGILEVDLGGNEELAVLVMLQRGIWVSLLIGHPVASVDSPISASDLPEALPEVVHVMPAVNRAISPHKHPVPVFPIVQPLPLVLVTAPGPLLPHALPAAQTRLEIPLEETSARPVVLPVASRLPLLVVALVGIAVGESLQSFAVFEAVSELSLVAVAVGPSMHAVAFGPPLLPLSDVGVALGAAPDARAVLQTGPPLPLVHLPVLPLVPAAALGLPLDVLPAVDRPVAEPLVPQAAAHVVQPVPLEEPAAHVQHHAAAVPASLLQLAPVRGIAVPFDLRALQILQVEHVGLWFVLPEGLY